MDNYSLHNRMQKMFLLVGMLGFLLLPNTVAAEYVDEYVAKHPRRVKITISQNAKGQYSGEALFKLFEHNVGGYRLKLDFLCDAKGPDLILLHCSTFGGRYTPAITELSYGDGEKKHVLHKFVGLRFPIDRHSYGTFQIAHIKPSELHDAIVVSANNVVIINNQHKRWPEFQQALKDAGKLYEERHEIWKRLNEMANNASKK
jgi:hypothetical protein